MLRAALTRPIGVVVTEMPELLRAPVEPMPRPSPRGSAWLARRAPVDAALRIVIEALGLTRALKPRIRLPMMEDAHRHEVVHRVAAAPAGLVRDCLLYTSDA